MKDMTVQTAEQEWKVPDQTDPLLSGLMPLTGASFPPGRCVDYIGTLKDGAEKEIARAEYHYFRGEPETALQLSAKYLASPDMMIRLSASLLYVYSCISLGQTGQAGQVLSQLKNIILEFGVGGVEASRPKQPLLYPAPRQYCFICRFLITPCRSVR